MYHHFIQWLQEFFKPENLYTSRFDYMSAIDACLTGFSDDTGDTIDGFVVDTLRENLFLTAPKTAGLDLVALNIQRGREHGIPSEFRQ